MSRIIVDGIRNTAASSDALTLSSDGKVTFPNNTGNILQVVSTTKTDTTSATSTLPTFVDMSGMNVAITPSSSSNKINLSYNIWVGAGSNNVGFIRIQRKIGSGSYSDIAVGTTTPTNLGYYGTSFFYTSDGNTMGTNAMSFLDSPSTTSEVTYKLTWCSHAGAAVYLNSYTSTGNYIGVSTITAMEVAA